MSSRALVVDADLNLQVLLKVLLARAGYTVDFAADGVEGLQKLLAGIYDAILLELLLPSLSGVDVLVRLERERPHLMPHIIVVSVAQERLLQKARQFPVHAVIRKPFDVADLLGVVRSCPATIFG